MSQHAKREVRNLRIQRFFVWLFFVALFLLLARIGARHYFKGTDVQPGTFPVTVGRIFAQWTVALLLLQSVLAVRIRLLDRVFGLDALLKFHRVSGAVCLFLGSMHPLLIHVSGLKKAGPLSFEQWPEAIGGICIVVLWLAVVSSVWRKFVELNYEQWLKLHKITASAVFLALAHMFIIESAMRKGWILGVWIAILALWVAVIATAKLLFPAQRAASEAFVVTSVAVAAKDVWQIDLEPAGANKLCDFLPGQFAFLSIENSEVPAEAHPFTIASAPSSALQFLIKADGDWTKKLHAVRAGDKARVSGPFGVFSPFRHETENLVMIAGGIGITPMLSCLRQLGYEKSQLPVKLIWSFKTMAAAPCLEELEDLRQQLPALEIVKIATQEPSVTQGSPRRLDKETLGALMPEVKPDTMIMLCGPVAMMSSVRQSLLALGWSSSAILSEEFAF